MCQGAGQVAFEWSLLERVTERNSPFPTPQVIDDSNDSRASYFYVMERVRGRSLDHMWNQLSIVDKKRLFHDIVRALGRVHETGNAFCDVKPQNILVDTTRNLRVRFVDVGGVTPFGRAVRQFTPTSDPAYWGFADRRASAAYDIAAITLTVLFLERPIPTNVPAWSSAKRRDWVTRSIDDTFDGNLRVICRRALSGVYTDASDYADALARLPDGAVVKRGRRDWSSKLMWTSLASACLSTAWAWALFLHVF